MGNEYLLVVFNILSDMFQDAYRNAENEKNKFSEFFDINISEGRGGVWYLYNPPIEHLKNQIHYSAQVRIIRSLFNMLWNVCSAVVDSDLYCAECVFDCLNHFHYEVVKRFCKMNFINRKI